MKVFIFLTILLLSSSISSKEFNCFSNHIKDAISKNKKRKEKYSKMTDGRTEKLSNLLINSERLSLLFSKIYDFRARKFQRDGVPVLCLDYVNMDLTPTFSYDLNVPEVEYRDIPEINISRIKKLLKSALKNSFFDLQKVSETLIYQNVNSGHYNCMFIHVLESIRKSANLAPHYKYSASERGLKSPLSIVIKNIKLQINTLGIWYSMDKKAAQFQEEGVKILCQDVPKIELATSKEINSIYR